jgi:preprotein translocase subunit SecE
VRKVGGYLSEVRNELVKVTWPTRTEVLRLTLTIFIITAVVGAYVGALDYGFTRLLTFVLAR